MMKVLRRVWCYLFSYFESCVNYLIVFIKYHIIILYQKYKIVKILYNCFKYVFFYREKLKLMILIEVAFIFFFLYYFFDKDYLILRGVIFVSITIFLILIKVCFILLWTWMKSLQITYNEYLKYYNDNDFRLDDKEGRLAEISRLLNRKKEKGSGELNVKNFAVYSKDVEIFFLKNKKIANVVEFYVNYLNIVAILQRFYCFYMRNMRYVRYIFFKIKLYWVIKCVDKLLTYIFFDFFFCFFLEIYFDIHKAKVNLYEISWFEFFRKRVYIFFIISMFFWIKNVFIIYLLYKLLIFLYKKHKNWVYSQPNIAYDINYTTFNSSNYNEKFILFSRLLLTEEYYSIVRCINLQNKRKKAKFSYDFFMISFECYLYPKTIMFFESHKEEQYKDIWKSVKRKELLYFNSLIKWFIWYKFICTTTKEDPMEERGLLPGKDDWDLKYYPINNEIYIKPMEKVIKKILNKLKKNGIFFKIELSWKSNERYSQKPMPYIKIGIKNIQIIEKDITFSNDLIKLSKLVFLFSIVGNSGISKRFAAAGYPYFPKYLKKSKKKWEDFVGIAAEAPGGYEYTKLWYENPKEYYSLIKNVFNETFFDYNTEIKACNPNPFRSYKNIWYVKESFFIEKKLDGTGKFVTKELQSEEVAYRNKKYDKKRKKKRMKSYIVRVIFLIIRKVRIKINY